MDVVILDHTAKLGGAEIALVRYLSRLDRRLFHVTVILFEHGPLATRLDELGIANCVVPLDPDIAQASRESLFRRPWRAAASAGHVVSFTWRLRRTLKELGGDLVVANSLKAGVLGGLAARSAAKTFVWHLHDRLSADYMPSTVAAVMRALARHLPDHVVVNSQATLASLEPIDPSRVTLAYPGLPEDSFISSNEAHPPVVGIIGRISPTKGQREFVRAAALVLRRRPDTRFHLVGAPLFGEDEYDRTIRAEVTALGLDDRVVFTGWADEPGEVLRTFSVLVHASPVPEPFGQVVVEAMAAGVPVVGTAAGGILEILDPTGESRGDPSRSSGVRQTELGQLVRPGDVAAIAEAVARVLQQPDAARAAARRARESARSRFSIDESVRAITAAWEESTEQAAD